MTEYVQVVLIANLFRALCLIIGLGFAYLGYRLYAIGVFEKAQELKAAFGKANITLKQVAPGVVFGVAGIIIAGFGVVRPVTFERGTPQSSTVSSASVSPASDVFISLNDDLVQKISAGGTLTQSDRDRILKLIRDHDERMKSSMKDQHLKLTR